MSHKFAANKIWTAELSHWASNFVAVQNSVNPTFKHSGTLVRIHCGSCGYLSPHLHKGPVGAACKLEAASTELIKGSTWQKVSNSYYPGKRTPNSEWYILMLLVMMMLMMMVRMMIWNEKVSATVVWRWKMSGHAEQSSLKFYTREHVFTRRHSGNRGHLRTTCFNCGQRVAVSDDGARATIDNGARNRSSSFRWCNGRFRSTQRPWRATAAGSHACSRRVQGTRPRPRTKSATWPKELRG